MSFWKKLFGVKKSSCCGCCCSAGSNLLNIPQDEKDILKSCDDKIVIGKILEITAHPDPKLTKVRVTKTDIGGTVEQILCGGVNIEVGAIVPVATVGTVLGENFVIGEREIRGVVSRGMICSRTELQLPQGDEGDHGIWILPSECEVFLGKQLNSLL